MSRNLIDAGKPVLLASPCSEQTLRHLLPLCLLKCSGRLKLTGSLGEVIRMSGELALS